MPKQYQGNGIDVNLFFTMTSATSGDVDWKVSFERLAASDQDIDSALIYSSATTITDVAVPSVSGEIAVSTITVTSGSRMDNIVAGDMFSLKLTRDAATDTATGDAELLGVELRGS